MKFSKLPILFAVLAVLALGACSPEVGSEEWCAELKEKSKADWTATEAKDYAKHCILK